ncbi:MAG TPA: hypothetical protein VGH89_38770 [Pseudonocardia sp.]
MTTDEDDFEYGLEARDSSGFWATIIWSVLFLIAVFLIAAFVPLKTFGV